MRQSILDLTDEVWEPLTTNQYERLAIAIENSVFTRDELDLLNRHYPDSFKLSRLRRAAAKYTPNAPQQLIHQEPIPHQPRLTAVFPPGFRGDILVHTLDNGIVVPIEDRGWRHAWNVLGNAVAFGPLGLMSPKNIALVCVRCEKSFVRNVYAYKRQAVVDRLIRDRILVVRQHSEPDAVYDPAAKRA